MRHRTIKPTSEKPTGGGCRGSSLWRTSSRPGEEAERARNGLDAAQRLSSLCSSSPRRTRARTCSQSRAPLAPAGSAVHEEPGAVIVGALSHPTKFGRDQQLDRREDDRPQHPVERVLFVLALDRAPLDLDADEARAAVVVEAPDAGGRGLGDELDGVRLAEKAFWDGPGLESSRRPGHEERGCITLRRS